MPGSAWRPPSSTDFTVQMFVDVFATSLSNSVFATSPWEGSLEAPVRTHTG